MGCSVLASDVRHSYVGGITGDWEAVRTARLCPFFDSAGMNSGIGLHGLCMHRADRTPVTRRSQGTSLILGFMKSMKLRPEPATVEVLPV